MKQLGPADRIRERRDVIGHGAPGGQSWRGLGRTMAVVAVLAGVLFSSARPARAVLIATGSGNLASTPIAGLSSGTSNTVLNAVGMAIGLVPASAVYLGNGWVITADHVGEESVTFGATTYNPVGGYTQLSSGGNPADIIIYQVANGGLYPNVTPLQITSSAPTTGETVTAVGNGQGAVGSEQYYDASFASTTSALAVYGGYDYGGPQGVTERWGQGTLADAGVVGDPSPSTTGPVYLAAYGTTSTDVFSQYYTSLMDERAQSILGNNNEFVVTPGDSGGALVDSSGHLVGILEVMATYANQPGSTGLFGDDSGAVSLYTYASQINSIIVPEPASLALAAMGFAGIGWRLRRRRVRASRLEKMAALSSPAAGRQG